MKQLTSLPAVLSGLALAALAGCATPEPAPIVATDDASLTSNVRTALAEQKGLDPASVMVETYNGEVRLSGFAPSQQEIDTAVAAARSVTGVKVVRNDMQVK
ncbi:BON domain-containing protein [Massilia endophytica]|uniref:BON domain-containing protein n=1 Tax=Massilia endophytica TaxID=2899220 RepID=UPI001E50B615|nr:BON domain-containing protein [Massilia endophytica]UGQ47847.1 BON domain-containing protein [Massilia endophytica]